jgi:hypothetical protein
MDTILATRNLAKERNTAQLVIDEKIQQIAANVRETEFSFPMVSMEGDINLSRLQSLHIHSIVAKHRTHITGVYGIPEGIKNIQLENLYLVEAPQLPKSIETVNLEGNYIETVDFSAASNLRVLKLGKNRLKSLGELPKSLEELYIDNNFIRRLDLAGLSRLRILHCRNNKTIRIENIPASIVDLQVEEGNPQILLDYDYLPTSSLAEDNHRAKGTEQEFVESMHDYFEMKNKYEKSAMDSRISAKISALKRGVSEKMASKIAKQFRPKCVNCKRPVGTVFKTRQDRLIAYCGDTVEPCPLRIEIFKGDFESELVLAKYVTEDLENTKEQIIRQKMDVLFDYTSEEETVAKFKDLIEDYSLYSFIHKGNVDIRDERIFNAHKRELIKAKILRLNEIKGKMNAYMDEYKETGNRDMVHSAMDVYIREYMPEVNNLRLLKYSVMEMIEPLEGTYKQNYVMKLNQSVSSLRQLETLHGEIPRVLKFIKGNSNLANTDAEQEEQYDQRETDNIISFNDDSIDYAE